MDPANADTVLRRFFAASSPAPHPESLLRYERVQVQLRAYLEEEAAALLLPIDQELVALERQFSPATAYCAVLGAHHLLHALPGFLAPHRLLPDFHDRLAQISITSRLAQWLCSRGLVESEPGRQGLVHTHAAAIEARRCPVVSPTEEGHRTSARTRGSS